jgi:hypothetical protein
MNRSRSRRDAVVAIFTKVPAAGRAKTRMLSRLMPREAAKLQEACLRDTVALVDKLGSADPKLCVAGTELEAWCLASYLELGRKWRVAAQNGSDLGARMRNAMRRMFRAGARRVVILGTDTPWMGAARVRRALEALRTRDVVLGPTEDGGYYLLGARRPIPELFRGIPWGTSQVLGETLARLKAARIRFALLKTDFDLDRPDDLARALQMRGLKGRAKFLSRWLRRWKAKQSSRRRAQARRNKKRRPGRV